MPTKPRPADQNAPIYVPCVTCGYDLRALDASGDCPECGTAIAKSLVDDHLKHADRRWLAGIIRGQQLISIGLTVFVVLACSLFLLPIGASIIAGVWPNSLTEAVERGVLWAFEYMYGFLFIGALIAIAIGGFLLTALEPRESNRESPRSLRIMARTALIVATGLLILGEIVERISAINALPFVDWVFTALFLIALYGAVIALLIRLIELTRRTDDLDLASRIRASRRQITWLMPVFTAVFVANVFSRGANRLWDPDDNPLLTVVYFMLVIGMLVLGIMLLGWFITTAKRMNDARSAIAACCPRS